MGQKTNLALLSRGSLHDTLRDPDSASTTERQKRENRTKGLMAQPVEDPYKPSTKAKDGKYKPDNPQVAYTKFIKTTLANRRQV